VKQLQQAAKHRYLDPCAECLVWMALPNGREQAIGALERALTEYSPVAYTFPLSVVFDGLGDDPRVQALARGLKIPNLVAAGPAKRGVKRVS
jgi:hypothetical protein